MKKVKILIVDDMELIREGLKSILNLEDDMEVIGVCENGLKGYEMTKSLLPDIVLMDMKMPISNGIEGVKLIKEDFPNIVVVMLTSFDDDEYIIKSLANGANGYLVKDVYTNNLIQGIRNIMNGQVLIESHIAIKLAQNILHSKNAVQTKQQYSFQLSEREKQISNLLIKGYSNKKISSNLYLSVGTVKNYISSIYTKIGTNNREKAVKILTNVSKPPMQKRGLL